MASSPTQNVIVVGGSYVGLNLAESLGSAASGRFRVLLVEKNSHFQHLFAFPRYALTTNVMTHKAFIPYQRTRLGQRGEVIQASVLGLTKEEVVLDRAIMLDGEQTDRIPFAALAITTGTKLSPPSTLPESEKSGGTKYLREHAARVETSQRIVIIGGGAVGVQMATDLKELFPEKSVTLVHSRPNVMSRFHPRLHQVVQQRCDQLGVQLVLGRRVNVPAPGYANDGREMQVSLVDGTLVSADFVIVSTGQTPQSDVLRSLAPECMDAHHFIKVKDTLQIQTERYPNIFALGDVAATRAPKAARPALAQAEVVTRNILRLLGGGEEALARYEVRDPAAIHLTLGIEKSVIFRNPKQDGSEEGELPVIMHKDDGKLDMGIDGVWARRGADITQALL